MSKELEALERMYEHLENDNETTQLTNDYYLESKDFEDYKLVKSALEILEILKSQFNYTDRGNWYIDFDEYCLDTKSKENKLITDWLENEKIH